MSDGNPAWPANVRELQELFVDVTGRQTFTDVQAEDKGRGVIHATGHGDPSRPEDVETDPDEDARRALVAARHDAFDDTMDARPNDVDH